MNRWRATRRPGIDLSMFSFFQTSVRLVIVDTFVMCTPPRSHKPYPQPSSTTTPPGSKWISPKELLDETLSHLSYCHNQSLRNSSFVAKSWVHPGHHGHLFEIVKSQSEAHLPWVNNILPANGGCYNTSVRQLTSSSTSRRGGSFLPRGIASVSGNISRPFISFDPSLSPPCTSHLPFLKRSGCSQFPDTASHDCVSTIATSRPACLLL